jgi:hypothetical protein
MWETLLRLLLGLPKNHVEYGVIIREHVPKSVKIPDHLGEPTGADGDFARKNMFKGKTPSQIDEAFRKKGFEPRGPDPIGGKGGYVNPKTDRPWHTDRGKGSDPPHVDVNRLRRYKGPLKKYKCPL